jgi:NADPH2:quinone reductase
MRAVVVAAPGSVAIERLPDPEPLPDEVVMRVRGCGICGTDLHIIHEGLPTARYPLIPGHEPWGEVVEVRDPQATVRVGDLVAVDPSLHCGRCSQCRQGRGNLCEHWGAIGGTRAGAWADLVAVPGRNLHRLDTDYPIACASIIEPVACGIRGIVRLQPQADRSAIIYGGGTMGVILALLLELEGVGPITIAESNARRRTVIAGLAQAAICDPADLEGRQADYVIDATGNPAAIEPALDRVAPGGTLMVFGVASPAARVSYSPFAVYQKEITIVGSMAILHTYGRAVHTVQRHAARFAPLLTHSFSLQAFDQALATLASGEAIKVTITPGGGGAGP